jgi:hypothetical protein
LQFVEQGAVTRKKLQSILERSGLAAKWQPFERKYWKEQISKPKMPARLAALSFSEKIKILEKLRERSAKIAASALRRKPVVKKSGA